MSKILGAKLWWCWVNHSMEPWVKLWNTKYDWDRPRHCLIRFNEAPSGSPIWLKALAGKLIIQEHSFWEIRVGSRAKLWDDSWNQFPILGRDPRWAHIKHRALKRGKIQVNQSWQVGNHMEHHQWDFQEKPEHVSEEEWEAFHEELNKHFIKVQEGPDILRLGYMTKGSFSVKEAMIVSGYRGMM